MEIVHTHCAGLDVHKKTVVAAIIVPDGQGGLWKEVRTFDSMTSDLLALSDCLMACGVTHVAMESTGEYWKPVFNILENNFEVLLVNAQHIKAVPGRKTDVKDSEWIAELLRHGLLKASFVPPLGQRELRDLTRSRSTFVRTRATLVNRVHKVLEGANIKLASVASDVMGVSGRAMLEAIVEGRSSPTEMAVLAGSILSYLAATAPAAPTGFWDRQPRRTPGRFRRMLMGKPFPQSYPLPSQLRKKASVTGHLPKGILAQRRKSTASAPTMVS